MNIRAITTYQIATARNAVEHATAKLQEAFEADSTADVNYWMRRYAMARKVLSRLESGKR